MPTESVWKQLSFDWSGRKSEEKLLAEMVLFALAMIYLSFCIPQKAGKAEEFPFSQYIEGPALLDNGKP